MTSEANELLDIESLRNPSELPHHWKLRKEFLSIYNGKYDKDRLVSLSHLFVNITCLGLSYPQEVMDKVEELGKSIDTKLIQEASVEESFESRDDCDEPQQQQHHSSRYHNNSNNNYYNNYQNNNQSRQFASGGGGGGGRPYSRPRFQQSNYDNRQQPYQQQNQQQYQGQPQRYYQPPQQQQQYEQPPQQFARYSEEPRFFRPQELRPRSDRPQGSGHRQPFYRPRQRGNYRGTSDGFNRRSQQ